MNNVQNCQTGSLQFLGTLWIGGVKPADLFSRLQKANGISDWDRHAEDILMGGELPILDAQQEIVVIELNMRQLGYTTIVPSKDVFNSDWLATYASQHLPEGYILDFCPAEVAPHFCDQHPEHKLRNSHLHLVMEPVLDSQGKPATFCIDDNNGRPQLRACATSDNEIKTGFCTPKEHYLFRLRKKVSRVG